jgi:mono/diheme cytochrome c family protein
MGLYKFVSTPAGSPPLEEDLLRTITHGLHGTSMPSWRLLSLGERRSLARRVRSFHRDPDPDAVVPAITFHENPFDLRDAGALEGAISRGRELYHKDASCWSCHVAYMEKEELERLTGGPARADLHSAVPKPDVWAEVIVPPDFRTDVLKSVEGLDDIYRVIAAGVGGTAMPTWKDALNAEALWALTIYVDSLRPDSVVRRTLAGLKEARGR